MPLGVVNSCITSPDVLNCNGRKESSGICSYDHICLYVKVFPNKGLGKQARNSNKLKQKQRILYFLSARIYIDWRRIQGGLVALGPGMAAGSGGQRGTARMYVQSGGQ